MPLTAKTPTNEGGNATNIMAANSRGYAASRKPVSGAVLSQPADAIEILSMDSNAPVQIKLDTFDESGEPVTGETYNFDAPGLHMMRISKVENVVGNIDVAAGSVVIHWTY